MNEMTEVKTNGKKLAAAEAYDLYAPAIYGKILTIVHKEPIADSILRQVFVKAFNNNNVFVEGRNPLITLLNHSREKSYQTLKALNILNQCCAGMSVRTADMKSE